MANNSDFYKLNIINKYDIKIKTRPRMTQNQSLFSGVWIHARYLEPLELFKVRVRLDFIHLRFESRGRSIFMGRSCYNHYGSCIYVPKWSLARLGWKTTLRLPDESDYSDQSHVPDFHGRLSPRDRHLGSSNERWIEIAVEHFQLIKFSQKILPTQ